jgi:uncharacterized protein (DUF58 family)
VRIELTRAGSAMVILAATLFALGAWSGLWWWCLAGAVGGATLAWAVQSVARLHREISDGGLSIRALIGDRELPTIEFGSELEVDWEVTLRVRSAVRSLVAHSEPVRGLSLPASSLPFEPLGGASRIRWRVRAKATRLGRVMVRTLRLTTTAGADLASLQTLAFVSAGACVVPPPTEPPRRLLAALLGLSLRRAGDHRAASTGDGFETRQLRAYAPGDSMRRIAWKHSARAGSWIVRDHDAEVSVPFVVAVDLAPDASEREAFARLGVAAGWLDAARRARMAAGLVLTSDGRLLAAHPPRRGAFQAARCARALAHAPTAARAAACASPDDLAEALHLLVREELRLPVAPGGDTAEERVRLLTEAAVRLAEEAQLDDPELDGTLAPQPDGIGALVRWGAPDFAPPRREPAPAPAWVAAQAIRFATRAAPEPGWIIWVGEDPRGPELELAAADAARRGHAVLIATGDPGDHDVRRLSPGLFVSSTRA